MNRRVIIVGFNNEFLQDSLLGKDIHRGTFTFRGNDKVYLDKYVYEFTSLYNSNGVFFDNIFETIHEGIQSTNNLENIHKCREAGVVDCYSLLPRRVNKLLSMLTGSLLICKIEDNKYNYLLDFFNVKKVYLDTDQEVINYLKTIRY